MVRNYKRISGRKRWNSTDLRAAIEAVNTEGCSVKGSAASYNIPRQTLRRHLKKADDETNNLGRFDTVFTKNQEEELVQLALQCELSYYGLTTTELRSLAFQLAERNKIPHTFNKETQLAGVDWLSGFRKRHRELSLRIPEATSVARAQAFNRIAVGKFYDMLEEVGLGTGKFPENRIYNVDETSVLTVQTKRSKIFALRGKRQVAAITSAERGILSTATICMSATGHYIPPMLIFPRIRMTEQLKKGAPPGTIFSCNASGWMTCNDFCKWFDHFLDCTRPTPESPVLLLLDGHCSHVKNLAFIEKAREQHVTVISFPPHCSHRLQPLDVCYMGSLKTHFSKAIEAFLKENPGKTVGISDISSLLGKAFFSASTPAIAMNGFRKSGIVPLNRHVFTDADFAASDVSDIPFVTENDIPLAENSGTLDGDHAPPTRVVDSADNDPPFYGFGSELPAEPNIFRVNYTKMLEAEIIDSSSHSSNMSRESLTTLHNPDEPIQQPTPTSKNSSFDIPPVIIRPMPKMVNRNKKQKTSKKEKASVITSNAYRNALKSSQASKDIKELNTIKRKLSKPAKDRFLKKRKVESETHDSLCARCGVSFSTSTDGENWNKCINCHKWFHHCEDDCPSC